MNRLWVQLFLFCLANLAVGCGGTSDDGIVRRQKEANQAVVDQLAKVQDVAGMKDAMDSYAKARIELLKSLRALSENQRQKVFERLESETQISQDKVKDAIKETQERLLKSKPHPQVLMQTSMGPVKIELYEAMAPVTVKNFLSYVDDKFFDGTIFHRVIPDFMIQGGGFSPTMQEKKTRGKIVNEAFNGLANERGTLAMARTNDPDSATAQFFINVKDNPGLDRNPQSAGYAVFGRVIDGMDVVDKIRNVETRKIGGHEDVPQKAVIIESIRRVDKK